VASASFAGSSVPWLAFAISIGTLVVSAGVAYSSRRQVGSLAISVITAAVSAWTIVASLVFSTGTVENLALASALALGGLAVGGLTAHEIEHTAQAAHETSDQRGSRLAAAA
jgi:hypothetical protein